MRTPTPNYLRQASQNLGKYQKLRHEVPSSEARALERLARGALVVLMHHGGHLVRVWVRVRVRVRVRSWFGVRVRVRVRDRARARARARSRARVRVKLHGGTPGAQ